MMQMALNMSLLKSVLEHLVNPYEQNLYPRMNALGLD